MWINIVTLLTNLKQKRWHWPKLLGIVALMFMIVGCVFVPNSVLDQSPCEMYTPKWELSVKGITDYNMCNGSGRDVGVCLVAVGVVIPLGSILVSGSVILVGNTIHWLEYHGHCDDGAIKKSLTKLRSETSRL